VLLYRKIIIGGVFIWLLTLGVIAGLVAGVVQGSKEMHTMNARLTALDGSTIQCANSDFHLDGNGQLVVRPDGSGRRLDDGSSSVLVQQAQFEHAFSK